MKSYKVKDLMVPLSEYATISEGSTVQQAFDAFKQAQTSVDQRQHQYLKHLYDQPRSETYQ